MLVAASQRREGNRAGNHTGGHRSARASKRLRRPEGVGLTDDCLCRAIRPAVVSRNRRRQARLLLAPQRRLRLQRWRWPPAVLRWRDESIMRLLSPLSRHVAVVASAIALVSCVSIEIPKVTPGRYSNHREMAYSLSQNLNWPGAPIELQREMQKCIVDTAYSLYTPQDIARLDKWARGEQQITEEEFWAIDKAVNERAGGEKGAERAMRATCPDTIKKPAVKSETEELSLSLTPAPDTSATLPRTQEASWFPMWPLS